MNKFPDKATVERIRAQYPVGTRIALDSDMQDPYSPIAAGTRGEVVYVDDCGHLGMKWDNGQSLNIIIGEDNFRKLTRSELVKEQARLVALTGRTNMLARNAVFEISVELGYDALADFIFTHTADYGAFILTGELPADIDTEETL